MTENEIRIDPRTGFVTIIAADRNKRPSDFEGEIIKKTNSCPFDPGNENQSVEIMRIGNPWKIRVIENKFPELKLNSTVEENKIGNYLIKGAYGKNEVIIDTPIHNIRFFDLDKEQFNLWIDVLSERENVLYQLPRISHVFIFKNDGQAAGESLIHPHTQIMASPFIPEIIEREKSAFYKDENLLENMTLPQLLLEETDNFVCIAPYASRFAGETLIYSKKKVSSLIDLTADIRHELAFLIKTVLQKYSKIFTNFSYNLVFHEIKADDKFRFHVEIYPRLTIFAGIEIGAGAYVNPLPPETFAQSYKNLQASPLEAK